MGSATVSNGAPVKVAPDGVGNATDAPTNKGYVMRLHTPVPSRSASM